MILLLIVGLVAIIFGRITVTRQLRLEGKFARFYGIFLLLCAYPLGLIIGLVLILSLPASILTNPIFEHLIQLLLVLLVAVLIAIPFRLMQGEPKLEAKSDRSGCAIVLIFFAFIAAIIIGIVGYFIWVTRSADGGKGGIETSLTKMKLELVSYHVSQFKTAYGRYPTSWSELTDCPDTNPNCVIMLESKDVLDSWKNPFNLSCTGVGTANRCEIVSFGADGQAGGEGVNADIKKTLP